MNTDDFNAIVQAQIERSTSVLIKKADEYASDTDRLANFKVAANLQGISDIQALAGMMAKHTQSVYAMIWDGKPHSKEMWEEKITDHINYLLLLTAVVAEDMMPVFLLKEASVTAAYEITDLVFTTKKEAEAFVVAAKALIAEHQQATVADIYDLAGITATFRDTHYAWKELFSVKITKVDKGYGVYLPDPLPLEE